MPRLSVLFSLSGIALSATPVDFPSPLSIGEDGRFISAPHVYVAGSSQRGTPLPLRLTSGPLVIIGADVSNSTIAADFAFNMIDNIYRIYPLLVPNAMNHGAGATSYLGIGANSNLTRQSGSVAVVRRNSTSAELIISSTREHFLANCRPDTLVTVDASAANGQVEVHPSRQVEVQLNLWNGDVPTSLGPHRLLIRSEFPVRARIPRAMYDNIREQILSNGFVPGFRPREFSECSEAVIASLPFIDFRFETGSIVFYPEDYIHFNATDRTCEFRVGIATTEGQLVIDPLMLVGQNVRVTSENVWDICDASL